MVCSFPCVEKDKLKVKAWRVLYFSTCKMKCAIKRFRHVSIIWNLQHAWYCYQGHVKIPSSPLLSILEKAADGAAIFGPVFQLLRLTFLLQFFGFEKNMMEHQISRYPSQRGQSYSSVLPDENFMISPKNMAVRTLNYEEWFLAM